MTKSLGLERTRYDIRAIALCQIETDLNRACFVKDASKVCRVPQRWLGPPADLDGGLLLLALDAGRFITEPGLWPMLATLARRRKDRR